MTQDEAENIIRVLMPTHLSTLQTEVFRRSWQNLSYTMIAAELDQEYSYIKDVGAELWKLLSQALGIKVTKTNLQSALGQFVQDATSNDRHLRLYRLAQVKGE